MGCFREVPTCVAESWFAKQDKVWTPFMDTGLRHLVHCLALSR